MPRGYIDALSTFGLIEGWAHDETHPFEPLLVSVVGADGGEIAAGLAHLYRQDLAEAGFAHGWCYFRLRTQKPIESLRTEPLRLLDKTTNEVLHGPRLVDCLEAREPYLETVQQLVDSDPTTLRSLDQLEACEGPLKQFAAQNGAEAFVRTAYAYVLGRGADRDAVALYEPLIGKGRLTPYAMLRLLGDSGEFRANPRRLAPPNDPGFPFRLDP